MQRRADGWAGSRESHAQETGNSFLLLLLLFVSYHTTSYHQILII